MKKIVITKKITTIESVLPNHYRIFKILQHFGFRHTQKPEYTNLEKKLLSKYDQENLIDTLSFQKKVIDKKFEGFQFPASIAYSKDENNFVYHIVGTKKNIYDAMVVQTAYSIMQEMYGKKSNIVVDINFIGDKESVQKFNKELNQFFKKNQKNIPKNILLLSKKNIYAAFAELENVNIISENKKGVKEDISIPNPIDYLSEISRLEFKDILEYIENLNLNFKINTFLFNSSDLYSGIIFRVQNADEAKPVLTIKGGRHDIISKKILGKKEIPTLSVYIEGLKNISKNLKPLTSIKSIDDHDVKFFYAQFGNEARFKTLHVLDMLHHANILIHHDLSKDKISMQLQYAEKLNVPYLLLVGHKESLQNSVMVRNMKNLSQESVELQNLIEYIKKIL